MSRQQCAFVPAIRDSTSWPTRRLEQNYSHRTAMLHRHPHSTNCVRRAHVFLLPHPDYTDADRKITHWERPAWCAHPTGDINVQIADTPMVHTSRGSNPSSTQIINRITELPSTASRYRPFNPSMDVPFAASGPSATTAGGVVDEPLPPIL